MRNAAAVQICETGDGFFNPPPVSTSSATTRRGKKNTVYFPSGSENRSLCSVPRFLLRDGKVALTLNSFFFDLPWPRLLAHTASLATFKLTRHGNRSSLFLTSSRSYWLTVQFGVCPKYLQKLFSQQGKEVTNKLHCDVLLNSPACSSFSSYASIIFFFP